MVLGSERKHFTSFEFSALEAQKSTNVLTGERRVTAAPALRPDLSMSKLHLAEVELPNDSLAAGSLERIDFADAFRTELPGPRTLSLDEVARAIMTTMPAWVGVAFKVRDLAVRPFGLKTGSDLQAAKRAAQISDIVVGQRLGLFAILDRTETDLLLGEQDRHLIFRASVQLEETNGKQTLTFSTVVQFKNALGRAYFVPVKPAHKLVVKAMMQAGIATLFSHERKYILKCTYFYQIQTLRANEHLRRCRRGILRGFWGAWIRRFRVGTRP